MTTMEKFKNVLHRSENKCFYALFGLGAEEILRTTLQSTSKTSENVRM